MSGLLLDVCFGMLVVSIVLALFRLLRGPGIPDRIMAFECLAICAVAMVVLLSLYWESAVFVELILVQAALGFFGTMAFVFYLSRENLDDDAGGE